GSAPLANSLHGIWLDCANRNFILLNAVAYNAGAGVLVGVGTGNSINLNLLYGNGGLGIDLSFAGAGDGVTPNDPGDGDVGPNNLQNFPMLASAETSAAGTRVRFGLDTRPGRYLVEFYAGNRPGDANVFLGSMVVGPMGLSGPFASPLLRAIPE